MTERLLNDVAVAQALGVSRTTAARLRLAGAFPSSYLNGSARLPRVRAVDLDDFIRRMGRTEGVAQPGEVLDLAAAMARQQERIRQERGKAKTRLSR